MRLSPSYVRPTEASSSPIRILLVDDSAVARAMLSRIINEHPAFTVVGTMDRAERGIAWLERNRADIVLLDIEMPGRNGLAALPDLIAKGRGARIVMVSSFAAEGAAATLEALALGATDAIEKPGMGGLGRAFADRLIERLLILTGDGEAGARRDQEKVAIREAWHGPVACVAVGASTGGLHALSTFFSDLPLRFDAPILVTQHLPATFMPFFAAQLSTMSGRPCTVAEDRAVLSPGAIYLAPGDAHLICTRRNNRVVVGRSVEAVASRCMPSVDPMFESVAAIFGEAGVGVVLSGMGRDGTVGAAALAAANAAVLAQDDASAVIWGMPGSVAREGLASLVGPPDALARNLTQRGARR